MLYFISMISQMVLFTQSNFKVFMKFVKKFIKIEVVSLNH
jgi:hypothetical protein